MAFSSVVNLGAAPSGGYLVAQPVSTVETAAANPTATVLRPMSTTVGATLDPTTLAALVALVGTGLSSSYAPITEPVALTKVGRAGGTTTTVAPLPRFNAKDYGAVGDGVTNDTTAFAAALTAAAGGVLELPPGNYLVDPATITASFTRIVGAGPRQTTFTCRNPASQTFLTATGAFAGSTQALTANAAAGTYTVTVASAAAFAPTQWVLIGDNTVPDAANYPTRKNGEMARVLSTTTTTVTFDSPLAFAYATASSAFIQPLTSPLIGLGLSGIRFVNPSPGTTFASGVAFNNCLGVRVENCEFEGFDNPGLSFNACAEFTVANCSFRNFASDDVNGRYGYGINLNGASAAGEINNCRFLDVRHGVTTNGQDNGYGEATDITITACHAIACKLAGFDTHGGSSRISYIGCTIRGGNAAAAVGFQVRGQHVSLIGCRAYDMPSAAVYSVGSPKWLRISGGVFENIASDGMRLDGDLTGLAITGAQVLDVTGRGIYVLSTATGSDAVIQYCTIRGYATAGNVAGIELNGLTTPVAQFNHFQSGYYGITIGASVSTGFVQDNRAFNIQQTFVVQDLASSTRKRRNYNIGFPADRQTLAANGAVTFDLAKTAFDGDHYVTLQANATSSTLINTEGDGQEFTLTWVQDATGGRTYVWPTSCRFAGGAAPSDTTANKRTSVTFRYDSFTGLFYEKARVVAVG